MFRKISHIILSLFLLVATSGIALSRHYCGNSLVSTTIDRIPAPCCEADGCCHNEISFYQLDDDFSAPQAIGSLDAPLLDLSAELSFPTMLFTAGMPENGIIYFLHPPPLLTRASRLALMQSFLC